MSERASEHGAVFGKSTNIGKFVYLVKVTNSEEHHYTGTVFYLTTAVCHFRRSAYERAAEWDTLIR